MLEGFSSTQLKLAVAGCSLARRPSCQLLAPAASSDAREAHFSGDSLLTLASTRSRNREGEARCSGTLSRRSWSEGWSIAGMQSSPFSSNGFRRGIRPVEDRTSR